jgi:glycosyltransferase involved in cell wall biosynthesis
VGSVAVFRTQKRLDLWLDCAAALRQLEPTTRFLLVGDGPLRAEVEQGISARNLTDSVLLPGLKPDVRPYLAAMDVYLMTSDFEGVPIALLEAMSMKTIPVTTDAGGIPEVIENARSGFVRPRGDVAGLVNDTRMVLQSAPARRRELEEGARERIARAFSTRRMMEQIEDLYDQVV